MSQMESKVIALSAVMQSAKLVQDIARHEKYNHKASEYCISSLFKFKSDSVRDIYSLDSEENFELSVGLNEMAAFTNGSTVTSESREIWRYSWLILQLAKKLSQDDDRKIRLGQLLHSFNSEYMVFQNDPGYYLELSKIYQQSISTMAPKIMVYGENGYLQKSYNSSLVRCLLLAGVRAGFLWWQVGGKRWHFLFPSTRQNYAAMANRLKKQ